MDTISELTRDEAVTDIEVVFRGGLGYSVTLHEGDTYRHDIEPDTKEPVIRLDFKDPKEQQIFYKKDLMRYGVRERVMKWPIASPFERPTRSPQTPERDPEQDMVSLRVR